MKVFFKSLNACRMRDQKRLQYIDYLKTNGHELIFTPKEADYIIVWTCAFRADHRDAGLEKIKFYLRKFDAKVIVAGCLPDIAPELLVGFNKKAIIVNWKNDIKLMDKIFSSSKSLVEFDILMVEERLCHNANEYRKRFPDSSVTFHDQFIKVLVSEGCRHDCSYCSELNTFPPYKSFSTNNIKAGVAKIIKESNVYEIIFLADSLGQYGCDINTNLPNLINEICSIDSRVRIALNNLHLIDFLEYEEEMLHLLEKGVIRHINLPIQSGSDRILSLMKRKYTVKDIRHVFSWFNKIGFKEFDTHIIVGFPTETEKDFLATVDILEKYKPKYALVSKYMESDAAKASKIFPKVEENIIISRINRIETLMNKAGIICNCDGNDLSVDRLRRLYAD